MKLWVDDIRTPPDDTWLWEETSSQAISYLQTCLDIGIIPEIMSLDHDLGDDDSTRSVVLWCCQNDFWPVEVRVHSANPPGVLWLQGMIDRYHPSNSHKYAR